MRTTRRTSLAVAVAVAGLSLSVATAAPAGAAAVVNPAVGTSDAGTSIVITDPAAAATATETVTLKLPGHPDKDISGVVTHPGAGPLCIQGVSDSGCGASTTAAIDITNAFPGVYDVVRVQSPALSTSSVTQTYAKAYTVKSKPVFVSISPATRGQGSSSLITVTGKGFGPNPLVSFGDGAVVSDVSYVSATTIKANVAVDPTAALGTRAVSVTSADGYTATSPAAFTIAAAPTLASISQTSAMRSEAFTETFTGTNFVTGGDFAILINGVKATNPVASNGGTTVTATLTVDPDAVGGDRTVIVQNADGGRARIANGFRVVAPPSDPANVAVVPGDGQAIVAWVPPADEGSKPVTGYKVVSHPTTTTFTTLADKRQVTVTGLTNGTAYTFDVSAVSDDGEGPAHTTISVTPKIIVTLTMSSSRPSATSSEVTTLSGVLVRTSTGAPLASAPMVLHIAPRVGAAANRSITTDGSGHWSSPVKLTYTTIFTITYAGNSTTIARNAVVGVPVASHVVISTPKTKSASAATSALAVRGFVGPNHKGSVVNLYWNRGGGRLVLLGRGTIAADGTWATTIKPGRGTYVLVAKIPPTTGNYAGVSRAIVIYRR